MRVVRSADAEIAAPRDRSDTSGVGTATAGNRVRSLFEGVHMIRRTILVLLCAAALVAIAASDAQAQQAYGRQWGRTYSAQDWDRFYHYPYVYYPQNFWSADYFRSSEDLYYRYPPEMQIPVYNKGWQNYYPQAHKYYSGHHFQLDIF